MFAKLCDAYLIPSSCGPSALVPPPPPAQIHRIWHDIVHVQCGYSRLGSIAYVYLYIYICIYSRYKCVIQNHIQYIWTSRLQLLDVATPFRTITRRGKTLGGSFRLDAPFEHSWSASIGFKRRSLSFFQVIFRLGLWVHRSSSMYVYLISYHIPCSSLHLLSQFVILIYLNTLLGHSKKSPMESQLAPLHQCSLSILSGLAKAASL